MEKRKSRWRQRLYHIPLWLGYQYFWFWLFGSTGQFFTLPGMLLFFGYLVAQAGGSYVVIDYLMPRFLSERRYLMFLVFFLLTTLGSTLLIILCYYLSLEPFGAWEDFYRSERFLPATLVSTLNTLVLVLLLKLGKAWIVERQQTRELERENLETELKFLRSQWNPHFLFNTINSIYILIKKDPDLAAESLARFSDLLRYQLYECNVPRVPLERELDFIQNFIVLERLRKSRLELSSNLEEVATSGTVIAPNILLPFIENAFKYAPTATEPVVRIRLQHTPECWQFEVGNTFVHQKTGRQDAGGIGLQNVRRRLELLYPEQYELDIQSDDGWFRIALRLYHEGATLTTKSRL